DAGVSRTDARRAAHHGDHRGSPPAERRPDPLQPRSHPNPRPRGARRHCLRMLRRRQAQRRQGICGPATPTIGLSSTFAHPADPARPRRRGDRTMKRRDFIMLLGGAAVAWPLVARAQQGERMRRIAVLMGWSESDPQFRSWIDTFVEELAQLGSADGRNVQINVRWASGDVVRMRTFAKELVELQPDVILGGTTPVTAALQRETRTIPIVFVVVADPVGAGFVAGLPHPGGNITGFLNAEAAIGGKWLEMLKEIAPHVTRVAIMFNPDTAPLGGAYFLGSFEA